MSGLVSPLVRPLISRLVAHPAVPDVETGRTVVFALGGQSNMVGQGAPDGGPGYPAGTLQVARTGGSSGGADGSLVPAAEPLDHHNTGAGMSLVVEFVRNYVAAHPSDTVVLVPSAAGGTGFVDDRWNPTNDLYLNLVNRVNAVLSANPDFVFGGLLWHQGEKDAAAGVPAATYIADLEAMLDALAVDIGAWTANTPVVLGGMGVGVLDRNTGTFLDIQNALYDLASTRAYCSIADTRFPVAIIPQSDSFHWTAWSLREVGRRYAEAYERAAANENYVTQGPTTGAINLPGAEAGALRHWLLGSDNTNDTDLVYGGALSAQRDVALSRSTGFLSLPGQEGSGLYADILEPENVTICAVMRRTAGTYHIPIGQMFFASFSPREWGFTSNDRLYRPDGGFAALAQQDTLNTFYFYGISLAADGSYRGFVSNGGSPASVDLSGVVRNWSPFPAPLSIGPGLYYNHATPLFNGDLDVAEVIVFDGAKTVVELTSIYGNSKTRLAARGVTLS